jgi:hypothetical protein
MECGRGVFRQKCCGSITAWNTDKTQKDFWYAFIDKSVAAADVDMNVAHYDVAIQCVDSGTKRLFATLGMMVLSAAMIFN